MRIVFPHHRRGRLDLSRFALLAARAGLLVAALLAAGCEGARDSEPLTVRATSIPNAFTDLSTTEFDSLVDLRFVDTDRLLAAEITGKIYALDVGAKGALSLHRELSVASQPLPSGQSLQQVTAAGRNVAYATSPGAGAERVYLFDPENDTAATVRVLQIGGNVTIAGGQRPDSAGNPSGNFDPTFVHTAIKVGNKLLVTCSNLQSNFTTWNPGAVLVYDLDPQDPLAVTGSAPRTIFTTAFNPQTAIPYTTEGGKTVLLVANTGAFDFSNNTVIADGSIDVIDPDAEEVAATFPLSGQTPLGLAVARRRLFSGSSLFASVSVVDLRGLDAFLGAGGGAPANLSARIVALALALPRLRPGTLNFVADVAASASGRFVYAANHNDSSIVAIENAAAPRIAGQFEVAGRHVGPFKSLTGFVEVRPGRPGVDYLGPDLFTGAIFLDEQDETPPDTGNDNAIDAFVTSPR